ncbi:hypothetical protein [Rickettsia endosymbiont of Cantharis rufa]|uniref:hypothetical protein n=1 Tax=Rickettsia endosymbiont of Cantharis rufa TaxID=3066248 RepID=UPI0031329DCE
MSELLKALATSTSITSFSVYGDGMEVAELVDVLKTNKSLKHLVIDSSVMKNDDSMTLFSQALATNTTLASFKMAKYLTKVGTEKLTECLRINTGLKHFGVTAGGALRKVLT